MDSSPVSGGAFRGRRLDVVAPGLLLIALSLLGIWNEIRFQGCVEKRTAIEVAVIDAGGEKNPVAARYAQRPQECFRIPLKGD